MDFRYAIKFKLTVTDLIRVFFDYNHTILFLLPTAHTAAYRHGNLNFATHFRYDVIAIVLYNGSLTLQTRTQNFAPQISTWYYQPVIIVSNLISKIRMNT